jgi:hypothetical protein
MRETTALRARLAEALTNEFRTTRERGDQRLDDSLPPYSRFVRAEQARLDRGQYCAGRLAREGAPAHAGCGPRDVGRVIAQPDPTCPNLTHPPRPAPP